MKLRWRIVVGILVAWMALGIMLLLFRHQAVPVSSPETQATATAAATNSMALPGTGDTNPPALSGGPASGRNNRQPTSLQLMQEALELTDEQARKLEPVLQAQQKQLAAFRRETSLSRQERMARLKQMRETTEAQLKSILTPEQFEIWRKRSGEFAPAGSVNLPAG